MSDIIEIKRRLTERAQPVAELLLPGGRREGVEWRVGSTDGDKGRSLGVRLSGPKAGIWADFATGETGDLLDLWCAVRRVPLTEALDQARDWLGLARPEPYREPKKTYIRPPKPECVKPKDAVRLFLIEERNIPEAAINAYRVGEHGRWIVFPYLRGDDLVMVKHESIDLDASGKKQVRSSANTEDCLFGWHVVPEDAREVVITEGEKDALSMYAFGYPALSVPRGGGGGAKQKWIENEYERMDRFERIYLATDMDEEGEKAAEEIANRLGRHRCLRVRMPRKDGNQCLVDGVSKEEMAACIKAAEHLDPEGLRRPSHYADAVAHLFWPAEGAHVGYRVPYRKLGDKLLFRPAEVTLWSGAAGNGKSQILSDCVVDWIAQGSRVCLCSLEMKPAQTLKRMCKQVVGVDRPTVQAVEAALAWMDRGLLLWERVGKASARGLLEIFSYAHAKYGCDQFVIDSLMRLGIAQDDYNSQEKTVFEIVEWAIAKNVHVHLVAHSRKGGRDTGVPETEDIKGAMEIGANAFNIVTVWRDRRLEEDLRAAEQGGDQVELHKLMEKPGVVMNVAKQRNGDFEGKTGLWFDQATYRYHSSHDRRMWSREYLPAPSMAA